MQLTKHKFNKLVKFARERTPSQDSLALAIYQNVNCIGAEMKIGIAIVVIVISLITTYALLSTKHYAKSQLSNVCNFLNDETDIMPRVGQQAKTHLRIAKSKFSQFKCLLSNQTFHGGLPFTTSMHINSDSDEVMILYYGFSFPSPVYYHQSSYFEHTDN